MEINLSPTQCNLCKGPVIFTSNKKVYGIERDSGKMYYCTKCGAYVNTHKTSPEKALGILANKEMRDLRTLCHELFDTKWQYEDDSLKRHTLRQNAYIQLAKQLNIPTEECHFGYFDLDMLKKAYKILSDEVSVVW